MPIHTRSCLTHPSTIGKMAVTAASHKREHHLSRSKLQGGTRGWAETHANLMGIRLGQDFDDVSGRHSHKVVVP
jgi:hypothetical protein